MSNGNTVAFIYKAIDKYSPIARKIAKSSRDVTKSVGTIDFSFKSLGNSIKSTSSLMLSKIGAMTGALAAFVGVANTIRAGATFQDNLAELSAITGAAGNDLQYYGDSALALAKKTGYAQSVIVKSITDIASAKSELLEDPKGLMIITEQALLLAKASGIAVPEAINATVNSLNQFNAGADQASRFVNVLAAGTKVGAAQLDDMVESMKNAGSVASVFNVSFEETNALLQVLAQKGVKGAEAGTALRGTLSKLEKIAKGKIAPSKIGIVQSLEAIKNANLSNIQIIKQFGEENLRGVLVLRDNIPLIKQWKNEVTGTNAAVQQAAIRQDTYNSRMDKTIAIIRGKMIQVFLKLEPLLSKSMDDIGKWIDKLQVSDILMFVDDVKTLANALHKIWKIARFILGTFTALAEVILKVGKAIWTLNFDGLGDAIANLPQKIRKYGGVSDDALVGGVAARLTSAAKRKSVNQFTPNDLLNASTKAKMQNNIFAPQLYGNQGQQSAGGVFDINMNVAAPPGVIKDIKTKEKGRMPEFNLGISMAGNI